MNYFLIFKKTANELTLLPPADIQIGAPPFHERKVKVISETEVCSDSIRDSFSFSDLNMINSIHAKFV